MEKKLTNSGPLMESTSKHSISPLDALSPQLDALSPQLDALSPQLVEQGFGLLEVGRVKALREPAIDRCQQLAGFGLLPLLLPEATQAHGGPQLQGFGLLAAGDGDGLTKTLLHFHQRFGSFPSLE